MSVKIGHASKDENGKLKGGAAGDQTGKEVCTRLWYDRPWSCVIRAKSDSIREKIAVAMEHACKNDLIGYDQNQRNTLWNKAKLGEYDPAKVYSKCETDCSALVCVCCAYAGVNPSILFRSGNSLTTASLRSALISSGLFTCMTDTKYTKKDSYLLRGDILLCEGHHVAVALSNGSNANNYIHADLVEDIMIITGSLTVAEALSKTVTISVSYNSTHALVKPVQKYLKAIGLYAGNVDGVYGKKTAAAVKEYQKKIVKASTINQDGIITKKAATWRSFLGLA